MDLGTCIALPTLCALGAVQAEPGQISGGCVLDVDAGVLSLALQTRGLSCAEILCTFASTKPTRQTPPQLARTETNTNEM